jgi:hypothetical protein
MVDPCYRIVVRDELGSSYDGAFEGMLVESSNGETAIVGVVADQAHLQSILGRIGSLNLVLLSVNIVDASGNGASTA